ncbi:MAG: sulfite exporter TauE/SafE family protein [Flavobacteriales bacterium]
MPRTKERIPMTLYLILIGIAAGITSGLTGLGGGLITVPMLVWAGFSQYEAQGTSTATLLLPIGIMAAYNYYQAGQINWRYALVIALAFVVGSFLGSKIALGTDPKILRKIFGGILLLVAVKLLSGK